jgi:hypothetical protein
MQAVQADSNVDQPAVTGTGTKRGVGYYAGLVTTDLQVDNKASGADMLKRNLQLAGTLWECCLQSSARSSPEQTLCQLLARWCLLRQRHQAC